jgi:predicted RNA methylase
MKKYWSIGEGVFNCLIDQKRTIAFKKAIENIVREGDVVVDVGTGTGILAMFAVDAGAKKVYAIEYDEHNIKILNKNFELNGYKDKIILICGDARKVVIPEKADVVVCEMIATGLIEELQIPVMNNILKYAKKDASVLLKHYDSYVDLVYNKNVFYGKKLNIFRYEYPDIKEAKSKAFCERKKIFGVDFSKINKINKIEKKFKLKITKNGKINGIRISSETIFSNGTFFSYSPAYSFPIIFPIEEIMVKTGNEYLVDISYLVCSETKNLNYAIQKIK